MPAEIYLATEPVTVTAVGKQALVQAIEVTRYKSLALLLRALAVTGGSVTIRVITGMQKDTFDGWLTLGTFTATSVAVSEQLNLSNPLKYVLWEVSAMTASSATFTIQGIAREN